MAAGLEIGQLQALLADSERSGCRFAWIEGGSLVAGRRIGTGRRRIDFGGERKVAPGADASEAGAAARDAGPVRQGGPRPVETDPVERRSAGRRTGDFACLLDDHMVSARSQRALLVSVLQEIERLRPGTLDKLAAEKARTKRPVARQKDLLYDDASLAKFAEPIEGGWWVATNNSFDEVQKVIRRAAFHAGLQAEIRRSP